ncbi:Protein phosphatase 2C family protein [Leishmania donovani]|uniref:Protein phosphatase 2C family protein n=1 Tax=Leishmania donovani TaxID=5661 RepID=A0A504X060_LEIDO|nr:Protein phosphatase 2C family protein [Leishmania donovani]
MKAFPLQHKMMQRLKLPYIHVGTCEVMNLASSYNMDSFSSTAAAAAQRAATTPTDGTAAWSLSQCQEPFLGEMVAGGLLDSYTGREASTFVSSYLAKALSMHTVLPTELRILRKEDPSDPLLAIMMAALARRRGMHTESGSLVTEWELQHGCRGVWFSATVTPTWLAEQQRQALTEHKQQLAPSPQRILACAEAADEREVRELLAHTPFCLDVAVGCVGNSRAFGVARNALTGGMQSRLDASRERTVPLSIDHSPLRTSEYRRVVQAGGIVDSTVGDMIDGNPYYNVARSFGHWSMKKDGRRSPVEQKMIALPTVKTWRMLAGDALVLCNHAVFETRHQDDSSMDELAKVVGRGLSLDLPPEAIAASLCDFAVMVAVAGPAAGTAPCAASGDDSGMSVPEFSEWVDPGPLYLGACQRFPELRRRLQQDCARCEMTLASLIRRRWERVRDLLPTRHSLSLLPYYGKECGALQQIMEEEAIFLSTKSCAT